MKSLCNVLKRRGINTVADLINCSEEELMKIPHCLPKHTDEVKQKLAIFGLELRYSSATTGPESTTGNGTKKSLEEVAKKLEAMGLLMRNET